MSIGQEIKQNVDEVNNALSLVKHEADAIQVVDQTSYELAAQFVIAAKDRLEWIEDYWADDFKRMNDLRNGLILKRKNMRALIEPLIPIVESKMTKWRREEERKRQEAQMKAQAEAKRLADEQALRDAAVLEEAGRPEEAEAVMDRAAVPPPVFQPSTIPKTDGLNFAKTAKYRMVNPAKVRAEFMIPDAVKIGKTVRAMGKDAETVIGGIEVYYEEHSVRRS